MDKQKPAISRKRWRAIIFLKAEINYTTFIKRQVYEIIINLFRKLQLLEMEGQNKPQAIEYLPI